MDRPPRRGGAKDSSRFGTEFIERTYFDRSKYLISSAPNRNHGCERMQINSTVETSVVVGAVSLMTRRRVKVSTADILISALVG